MLFYITEVEIQQSLQLEKELLSHLDGIKNVFDGGAGCGRFSILLAKHDIEVTHFDISQPMINKAKELAEKEGVLDRISSAAASFYKYQERRITYYDYTCLLCIAWLLQIQ